MLELAPRAQRSAVVAFVARGVGVCWRFVSIDLATSSQAGFHLMMSLAHNRIRIYIYLPALLPKSVPVEFRADSCGCRVGQCRLCAVVSECNDPTLAQAVRLVVV